MRRERGTGSIYPRGGVCCTTRMEVRRSNRVEAHRKPGQSVCSRRDCEPSPAVNHSALGWKRSKLPSWLRISCRTYALTVSSRYNDAQTRWTLHLHDWFGANVGTDTIKKTCSCLRFSRAVVEDHV
jgi:hypothetical protein